MVSSQKNSTHYRRYLPSCIRFGRYVYVLGGSTARDVQTKTIERFDPSTGEWTMNDSFVCVCVVF